MSGKTHLESLQCVFCSNRLRLLWRHSSSAHCDRRWMVAGSATHVHPHIRGISKSIRHFIRHFIRHLTVLSVTWPFYPSLDRFIRHLTISARMWISLIILIQFDHQNDYDQSSSSVRVVISTIEHPTYACNMSQRWPVLVGTQVFVIADIWICWFGRFVFVKPSLSHLQTSDKHINTCFGAVMDFSQNMFCIFRVLLSTFADIC